MLHHTGDTLVGIQNAKEYIGVGLNTNQIINLYKRFSNFRVIKGETSSVHVEQIIKQYPKDLFVFNGRGGQEIIDNLKVGCKGIIPATEMSDYFIKIYNLIEQNKEERALKIYKNIFARYRVCNAIHRYIDLLWKKEFLHIAWELKKFTTENLFRSNKIR